MRLCLTAFCAAAVSLSALLGTPAAAVAGDFPEPSPYPIAWEFTFENDMPERIVVDVPGKGPRAYWYMTYTITNDTGEEQEFNPWFEMVTSDGKVHHSDRRIPLEVFNAIKKREGNQLLVPNTKVTGPIRLGQDEARDSVAIWPEPLREMGTFSIFVGSLSGEFVEMKDENGKPMETADGEPIILRKTLQLTYHVVGDEVEAGDPIYKGTDRFERDAKKWIMR